MLKPTKHTDPARSVLAVAAALLHQLRRKRVVPFGELKAFLRDQGPGTDILFVYGTDLLFLLGLIEYRKKTDSFEYVGPQ